jgi:hypothetical protein
MAVNLRVVAQIRQVIGKRMSAGTVPQTTHQRRLGGTWIGNTCSRMTYSTMLPYTPIMVALPNSRHDEEAVSSLTNFLIISFQVSTITPESARYIEDYGTFKVLSNNVMADVHKAVLDKRSHIENRTDHILHFLKAHAADIYCLQEVESEIFQKVFQPEFQKLGFSGSYTPKGRIAEKFTPNKDRTDGCATFFRKDKFRSLGSSRVELRHRLFDKGHRKFGCTDAFARKFLTKDQIVDLNLLEPLPQNIRTDKGGFVIRFVGYILSF